MCAGPLQLCSFQQTHACELCLVPNEEMHSSKNDGGGAKHSPFHHREVENETKGRTQVHTKEKDLNTSNHLSRQLTRSLVTSLT